MHKIFPILIPTKPQKHAKTATKPHLPVALGNQGKIIVKLQASTKTQHLITLNASDIKYGMANLEKSLPHRKTCALKGLRIIDSAIELTLED